MLLSLSSLVVIALLEVEVVVVWLPLGVDDTSKTPIRYSHQPGGERGAKGGLSNIWMNQNKCMF